MPSKPMIYGIVVFFIKKAASDAASHRPAERMRMKTTAMQAEVVAAPEGN